MNPAPRKNGRIKRSDVDWNQKRGGVNPAPLNWYYVYLLRSKKDGSIYIGCTLKLQKRVKMHKEGKSYSTKKMLPVDLMYFEAYRYREDAYTREKHLKYYSSALRNLKIRLSATFRKGGAG